MFANLEIMMNSTLENSRNVAEFTEIAGFFCFADEICQHIDRIEDQIGIYLSDFSCLPDVKALLRSMHSIKGTAGFWNVPAIQEAAHRAETGLVAINNGDREWSEAAAFMVGNACQELRDLLQLPMPTKGALSEPAVKAKQSPMKGLEGSVHWRLSLHGMDGSDDLEGVRSLLELMTDCVQSVEIQVFGQDHQSWSLRSTLQADELVSIFKMHVSQSTRVEIAPISEPISAPSAGSALSGANGLAKSLRVQVDSLSALQEIAEQLTRLEQGSWNPQAADLVLEFKQRLDSMRLVTVAETLERYEPMVQTLAQRFQKKIEWHLVGGSTQVDRRLMERVNEPLMHLVRNSCDHGIETESVRLAKGKLVAGKICLDVHRTEAGLHINLTDDGAGLSREALLARAQRQGLPMPKDPSDDAQIWAIIFEPGFSTASHVTDISGRGVGLDVVRQTILDLGGSVHVQSMEGQGLTFGITVPEPSGW